ncbi:hypothetical protein [uncultured Bradyrhizobium sp.]|nr:hypothetical protein [uncultured Bradyrhizobium sp.]
MQSVRPDSAADPIPLRQPHQGIGTIMIRFIGILAAATVVMVLIWNR